MRYEPLGDRIIVKQLKEDRGSFVIPKSAEMEDKAIGEVIKSNNEAIKVGDTVIYNEFAGEFIPGEEDLLIINFRDILAKRYAQ